ncbi:MAG: glycosyltransferase [Ferruginibacter sp.]
MPLIFFTVTNDLSYDQRMDRICTSLTQAGYQVTLIGRRRRSSVTITKKTYGQKRLNCIFETGKLFYIEFNVRLLIFLLFKRMDCICAIDLDTIVPCYYISRLKKVKRMLDSHEYFSQQKEVITRPDIYKMWHWIERKYLPQFPYGYTVSASIADTFKRKYKVHHQVIRNLPVLTDHPIVTGNYPRIILYQGAVNEARGFESLIPAMKHIDAVLHIYGTGNLVEQVKALISINNLENKVLLMGPVLPGNLNVISESAYIGVNLVENTGLNQYYSLANKFFDFIQNTLPQVTMNFPEYKKVNEEFEVAILIDETNVRNIEDAIVQLLTDEHLYSRLKDNCRLARKELNWQKEEKKLIDLYKQIVG